MKTTLKIAIACFIGATMGTFISLELNKMLWWLGAIAGGVIGYLIYDIEVVIKAIPRAYKATVNLKSNPILKTRGFWIAFSEYFLVILPNTILGITLIAIIKNTESVSIGGAVLIAYGTFLAFLGIMASILSPSKHGLFDRKDLENIKEQEHRLHLIKAANPISLPFYILYLLFYKEIYKKRNRILKTIKNFFKHLFILIHSQARLICGVDSLFGTVIGYFCFHSPIMGGTAGVVLGVLNYYIVSIRILKLEPKL